MKNLNNRLERLETISMPENKLQIQRIIIDSKDQLVNRDKYKKVLVRDDETRKIFELKK